MGIDPGLSFTGYGCVDLADGAEEPAIVEAGVLRLARKRPMVHRLGQLYEDLSQLLDDLKPDLMVVEKLFSHYRHVRTSILMGHARGVILQKVAEARVELRSFSATRIKKAITGNGRASKEQLQKMVQTLLALRELPKPNDVSDAIAAALCCANSRDLISSKVSR